MTDNDFIPGLGLHALTPLYLALAGLPIRGPGTRALLDAAAITPGMRVLDFGCGGGHLLHRIARRTPGAELVGLDIDPRMTAAATRRLAGLDARVLTGRLADQQLAPDSFDRVVTGLVLHHLTAVECADTLRQVRTLLRPDGRLVISEFAPLPPGLAPGVARVVRGLVGSTADAVTTGRLPTELTAAGFTLERVSRPAPLGVLIVAAPRSGPTAR